MAVPFDGPGAGVIDALARVPVSVIGPTGSVTPVPGVPS